MYLLSGQGGEWGSQHLIREYNRNINSLYKSWTPTEPNATGLFLEPYNAGFSYQGTGDFRDYKWDTYSLDFDGVDDYVELGSQAGALRLYNSNGTISAWIKIDDVSADDNSKRIVDKSDEGSGRKGYALWVRTNGQVAGAIDESTQSSSVGVITDATWHHVVWTWDGTNYKFYIDGSLDTTAADTSRPPSDTTNMRIGTWNHSTAREFKGLMDEVTIFDSALSAVQIRAIYNGGTPESLTPYSPLAWWRMGDGLLDDGGDKIIGDQMNLTLGSELITNGNFASDTDWTKAAGWSIAGGVASCDGTQASFTSLIQDHVHTINKACVLEFDLVSTNGEGLKYWVNGSQVIFDMVETSVGHKKYTFFTNVGGKAYFEAYSDFVGSITNVSVKDYNGNQGGMINMEASDIVADTPLSNKWDVYSVLFDGVDEYVDAGTALGDALGDNYAGSLTVSMWFKAGVTSGDDGMFEIGPFSAAYGEIDVALASNHLRFKLNGGGWERIAAFTDTASWHHIVCVYSVGSEANSKMYVDGVDQTALGTTGTFPSAGDMDFAGLKTIIGAYSSSSYPFDGNIDEVAVWDSALSAAQITAIYNGGTPQSLASYSPVSWWRMGDGDCYRILHDAAATDANALFLPAVAGNYASVPDAADLDGFTDFTLEAKGVTTADWTPSASLMLISKYNSTGNQRAWYLYLRTDGKLELTLSFNGSATNTYTSTAANVLAAGATADLMVMRNGLDVRFYVNGVQLGTDVTCVATALYNSSAPLEVGTNNAGGSLPFNGSVQRARVWNSAVANQAAPTETPVLDINFALATKGAPSFTATSGQTVTINTTSIANPAVIRGATDGVIINDAALRADTP